MYMSKGIIMFLVSVRSLLTLSAGWTGWLPLLFPHDEVPCAVVRWVGVVMF